jgi:hypothetical protein
MITPQKPTESIDQGNLVYIPWSLSFGLAQVRYLASPMEE